MTRKIILIVCVVLFALPLVSADPPELTELAGPATQPTNSRDACWTYDNAHLIVARNSAPELMIFAKSGDTLTLTQSETLGNVLFLSCHPTGPHFALLRNDGNLQVWENNGVNWAAISTGTCVTSTGGGAYHVQYSTAGSYLSVSTTFGGIQHQICSVDIATDSYSRIGVDTAAGFGADWLDDNTLFTTAGAEQVRRWEMVGSEVTLAQSYSLNGGTSIAIQDIEVDGEALVVSANSNPRVRAYQWDQAGDTLTPKSAPTNPAEAPCTTCMGWAGGYLFIGYFNGNQVDVWSWDAATEEYVNEGWPSGVTKPNGGRGWSFTSDGQYFAPSDPFGSGSTVGIRFYASNFEMPSPDGTTLRGTVDGKTMLLDWDPITGTLGYNLTVYNEEQVPIFTAYIPSTQNSTTQTLYPKLRYFSVTGWTLAGGTTVDSNLVNGSSTPEPLLGDSSALYAGDKEGLAATMGISTTALDVFYGVLFCLALAITGYAFAKDVGAMGGGIIGLFGGVALGLYPLWLVLLIVVLIVAGVLLWQRSGNSGGI